MTEPAWPLVDALVSSGASLAAAGAVAAEVVERLAEPHRHHHTESHVLEVLAEAHRLAPHEPGADLRAVVLAAWFHDVVYRTGDGAGASEAASAELAVALLGPLDLVDGDRLVAEVDRLVRCTAGHRVDEHDRSGAVLVDADLWILGAPPERYRCYVAAVRAEHAAVSHDDWVAGRGAVLRRFLAADEPLFGAGTATDRAERRARATANLSRELAELEDLVPPSGSTGSTGSGGAPGA